jgi:sulfur-oxidizing protein SoxY
MAMAPTRRELLQQGGGAGIFAALTAIGLIKPGAVGAVMWNKAAFETRNLDDTLNVLGAAEATETDQIILVAPDIAENGAVVPVGVVSKLHHTESIAILIEKNPNLLAAHFTLPAGTLPEVQTRIKMAQTSRLFVLVQAAGTFCFVTKEIQVILGGCGD